LDAAGYGHPAGLVRFRLDNSPRSLTAGAEMEAASKSVSIDATDEQRLPKGTAA
jgi:hypothetical protein